VTQALQAELLEKSSRPVDEKTVGLRGDLIFALF
jgi:hypothetical protein